MSHRIMAASAAAPGISHVRAMQEIASGIDDPILGRIHHDEVQLCPQHSGRLSEDVVEHLMESHPRTRFRIHATPRIDGEHEHAIVEAVNASEHPDQIRATAALSRRMEAPAYTLHAGRREHGTLEKAFENTRRLADVFGCRVGIEGLYPSIGRENRWLLATWDEHEKLIEADVDFAIDLSHLGIVAKRERRQRHDLVKALVSSPHCLECHVSDNDARADSHRPLTAGSPPWWLPFLGDVHQEAVIFYEGIAVDPRKMAKTNAA